MIPSSPPHWPVLLLLLLGGTRAAAQTPQSLADGVAAYNQSEHSTALMYLETARRDARSPGHLAQAYLYLGCTHFALGQRAKARRVFETLLAFDPGHRLPDLLGPPEVVGFFEEVRRSYPAPPAPPALVHRPPRRATGRMTRLRLLARNLSPRLRPIVRHGGRGPGFASRGPDQRQGNHFRFTVPTPAPGRRLVYSFALIDSDGVTVQHAGPFTVSVTAHRRAAAGSTPWYRTWWFWTAVGAVAVGAGVGLGLGLRGDDASRVSVTVLGPDGYPVFQ